MTATTDKLEANKKLARDYVDQVFNQHNAGKAADFVTGDVVWHGGGLGDIAGPQNLAGLPGVVHRGAAGPARGRAGHHRRGRPGRRPARRHRHGQGKPAGGAGRRQAGPVGRGGHLPGHRRQDQRGAGRRRRRGDHGPGRCLQSAVGCLTSPASSLRGFQNSASQSCLGFAGSTASR
jgi:hypothetical protein